MGFFLWDRWHQLKGMGVLGMNRRNHHYIGRYNDRSLYPLVDNKLNTKQLALEFGVSTPKLIAVVDNQHDVPRVGIILGKHKGFCIKPAKGSGGKGILVITESRLADDGQQLQFCKPSGEWVGLAYVQRHISNILAGLFSLGGATDVAMVETLLVPNKELAAFSFQGVPDIRVIVFRGIPVMAMMRLACAASHGKANLHQGAIGVGLDIHSGEAVHAVQNDHRIELHPDTDIELNSLFVPHWDELLELSMACQEISGLGYLGVDLVIDQHEGPTLLELNARPGLSIQIANNAGLIPRLSAIESLNKPELMSREAKLAYAREHF
ncbi:alpha-L-glutamate ligase-like protein [Agaribacterium sp. ZY112]|uniref:alpha-L-glutamate ligase-like protein n=1 Tax=Agaribacterium sp. ZY112 TaxID=3233574 RepID=UPI0035232D0D